MKKLLVALLCAAMLLCCAGAVAEDAETKTFGEFICYVDEGEKGLDVVDYVLTDGQAELYVPMEIDGYRVRSIDVSKLPESVKTVYMYNRCGWGGECADGRELIMFQYADHDWVSNEEWYAQNLTDLGEDDYALIWAGVLTWKNGDCHEKNVENVYAEDLPTELGGHKVNITMAADRNVIYTSGDWQYKLESYDSGLKARIVGCKVAEDGTSLLIPDQLDGYEVRRIQLAAIPAWVELIYRDADVSISYEKEERVLKCIAYNDYAGVKKDEWISERVPDMTESDMALVGVYKYTYTGGGMRSDGTHVHFADLPTQLLGKNCLNAIPNDSVYYTSGDWTYTLSYDGKGIYVEDVAGAEGKSTLLVPSYIEGKPVQNVAASIAEKYGISLFVISQSTWVSGETEASYGVLGYYDRAWVDARQDDYYTERYAWMGEKDLSLEGYTFYTGGDTTKETIEFKNIPTELEGYSLHFNMSFEDNVTQHKKDDFCYIILADDTIAVTKYDNTMAKSLIIPARIDGKTVTAIMGDGYSYAVDISDLTSLELPSTLKVIGKRAINAWDLKKLEIPAGVTEIGENAIRCYKLGTVKLPEGVTRLGKNWLYARAKSVTIPATLTTLDANAFSDADYISSIKLPDSVTNVGVAAFAEMYRLSSLTLPNTMVEIPERLAAASEKLAKITIPAGTEIIGKRAFAGCIKLSSVTFAKQDAKIRVIGEGAFSATALGKVALPEGVTTIGKEAFQGCTKLNNVTLPATLATIERYAFSGCTALSKIALPEGLTTIEEGTFMGCKKLANVTIPASVTAIEDFAFEGCSPKLVLTVTEGSFAQQWAQDNGYTVKLATAKK